MSDTVQADDGAMLPLASLPTTITWDGFFVATMVVEYQTKTYTQTYTNNGTVITAISGWVSS